MTDVGVVVGQLLRLLGDRLGDLFAAVADVHAVEAGEGVEQAGAVAVADVDTLAAGNDARTPLAARKLREVGRGDRKHTSELQSLMRISYAVFCLKKKKNTK